jgi:hypothetical protein
VGQTHDAGPSHPIGVDTRKGESTRSSSLTPAVLAGDIAICAIVLSGIAYAARAERRASATAAGWPYAAAAAGVLAWGALVVVLAREGVFATNPDTTTPLIVAGIAVPVIAGVVLMLRVPGVLRAVDRIPLQWLVGVQFYRVLGALFLIAYARDEMPGEFALPAGIGDVLVGASAVVVAYLVATRGAQRTRSAVLAWCVFGIADLVVAVGTGFLSAPSILQQLALDDPNTAITRYPFVLIPTYLVPISILLHVYVIARLRERSAAPAAAVGPARAA